MTDRPTQPTDRPGLRPAAPVAASVTTDHPTTIDRPGGAVTRPTAATDRPANRPDAPTTKPTGRFQQWRQRKAVLATTDRHKPIDPTVIAAAVAHHRPTTTAPANRPTSPADIAPVPRRLTWLGVWLDRTFGAMPLISPLVVSGYYTTQVFTGQPIGAHPVIAVLAACALEGGVWKLARLYEKTLVAGDSTIGLRFGIGMYLALISGLIYWHAGHEAQLRGQTHLGEDALPAAGVAVMSVLGVFIWSRTARWTRRQELHAQGRVDTQAPKFAALAWVLCPIETPRALRHAVKYRLAGPVEAVADLRLYRSVGRPSVWPPLLPPTDNASTDPTPTRPAPVAQPTRPAAIDRPTTTTDRPTIAAAVAPAPRPAAIDRPTTPAIPAPTRPAAIESTNRPEFSAAAIRNAADLRSRYGTTDLKVGTVRSDLGWSFDRADPAVKAYLAGADQTDQTDHATDRAAV